MLFSIIIPTCNRNDLLALCLEQLAPGKQNLPQEFYEVIVTDDGKDFGSEKLIRDRFPWARAIRGPQRGPAANRNNGASNAFGDWFIFIDDDCIPDVTSINAYKCAIELHNNQEVFEGRIYVDRPQQFDDEEAPLNEEGGYLWSCNFCIKRELFQMLEGFDESFPMPAMEDVDFNYRLKKNNIVPLFVYSAAVLHPWRRGKFTFRNQLKREASTKLYLRKHPEEKRRIGLKFHMDILVKCSGKFMESLLTLRFKNIPVHFIRLVYALRMSSWLLFH